MSQIHGPNSDTRDTFRIVEEILRGSEYKTIFPDIVPIFERNQKLGRVSRYMQQCSDQTLSSYLFKMAKIYTLESDHISELRSNNGPASSSFFNDLKRLAYHYLARLGVPSDLAHDKAHDTAQDTWRLIITGKALFPFDVSFGAWSTRILYNRIKKAYTRKKDILDQEQILWLDALPDDAYEGIEPRYNSLTLHDIRINITIRQALSSLSDEQRQACILFYFYKLPAKEVAEMLGCTSEAVNARCHRACNNLRRYLQSSGLDLADFLSYSHP